MTKSNLLILTAIFATGGTAEAAPQQALPRIEQVTFADLDLNSKTGQADLRHRIQNAASDVCDTGGMQSMDDFHVTTQCYRRSFADGVRQMDRLVAANRTGAALAASAVVIQAK
jgi:UrcA family protein